MAERQNGGVLRALAGQVERVMLGPGAYHQDVALRRNALLLSRLLAAMTLVFAVLDGYYVATVPGYQAPWYGYLFLLAAFALNRAGWYRASSWLVMMMFPVTILAGIVAATAIDPRNSLNYLFLSLLAGGILLSNRSLVVFIALEIAGVLGLPAIAPRAIPNLGAISTQLTIMVIGGALVVLWKRHRDAIEAERSAELVAAEGKCRQLIDTTGTGYVILDVMGRVHDANQEYVRLTGRSRLEEILGHGVQEWTAPHDRARNVEAVRECVERGCARHLEIDYVGPGGDILPVEINATLLQGPESSTILSLVRDITERRRGEQAERAHQEKLASIFRASPVGIGMVVNRVIQEVNDTLCRMVGYDAADLIGKSARILYPTEEEFDYVGTEKYRKIAESGRGTVETKWLRRDGTVIDVLLSSAALEAGDLSKGVTFTALDISDRKRAETDLHQAKQELERKYEELRKLDTIKDGLLRDVTHELKTPVAKQAMQIELLRSALGGECTERSGWIIDIMEQSVKRQERVIRNLLDLSRLEAGGRRMEILPLRLDGVLASVLEEYQSALDATGMEVVVNVPPLVVMGDGEMLWHVLANVVNNAIKFKKPEGPGRLEFTAAAEGGMTVLKIRDHGIGLSPEEQANAFERFYQATPSTEGSGVGLSICRMIISELHGTITLESEGRGTGATAAIALPNG